MLFIITKYFKGRILDRDGWIPISTLGTGILHSTVTFFFCLVSSGKTFIEIKCNVTCYPHKKVFIHPRNVKKKKNDFGLRQ